MCQWCFYVGQDIPTGLLEDLKTKWCSALHFTRKTMKTRPANTSQTSHIIKTQSQHNWLQPHKIFKQHQETLFWTMCLNANITLEYNSMFLKYHVFIMYFGIRSWVTFWRFTWTDVWIKHQMRKSLPVALARPRSWVWSQGVHILPKHMYSTM